MEIGDVRHLLRRFAFAATPAAERTIGRLPADRALGTLAARSRRAPHPAVPDFVREPWTNAALRFRGTTDAEYDALRATQLRSAQHDIELLRQRWLEEMIGGAAPLRENLVLFFQATFGSSSSVVDAPHALHARNALLRSSCLGSIPVLLEQLVLDPAMMMQIGMDEHGKDRVSDRPAKLILDYWTVGPDEYVDRDVEELSRALTGWRLAAPSGQGPRRPVDPAATRAARRTGLVPTFEREQFDSGVKTILGDTRSFDARTAIRFLARRPATARRFGRRLIRYFGVEDPAGRLEAHLVHTYRATEGSMEALLRELVVSQEFWSPASRWALIKSPVHLAVGACRQLALATPPLAAISRWLAAAGQTLFDTSATGEGGWADQEAWVTPPDRLTVRYQLPVALSGQVPPFGLQGNPSSTRSAVLPAPLPVGGALQHALVGALMTRLDPAPGLDAAAIERGATATGPDAPRSEIIRRIMTTPEYQLA